MRRSNILLLAVLVAAPFISSCTRRSTKVEQEAKGLSITVGKHRLTAAVVSREITDSFLVVGGSAKGDLYFTANFAAIPLVTAERLAQQYGDFRKCNSPGASQAIRSIKPMLLYAADRDVERRLRDVDKLTMARKDPVIKMTYVKLRINAHTIQRGGKEIQVVSQDTVPSFLVKDVQLIEENRSFKASI